MGRWAREESRTGCYHVTARGNNKQVLFLDESGFLVYLRLLEKYIAHYAVVIYHYCLMDNHIHLVLKVGALQILSRFMHDLQRSYFLYRQRRSEISGHLWQGPFGSSPIERESYLMEAGRYVERNPVEAGVVEDPGDYRWSSYRLYALGEKDPLVTLSPMYLEFGSSATERQERYRSYVGVVRPYEVKIGTKYQDPKSVPSTKSEHRYLVPRSKIGTKYQKPT